MMNIFLWILQGLLALHTMIGAIWKFSHTAEQTMPSLRAIPNSVWLGMSVLEIVCAVALMVPAFSKSWGIFAVIALAGIAAEMLLFTSLHFASGDSTLGPVIYWGIVFGLCVFIAYGRLVLQPF
ncbi:DoxX family protein [Bremerella alba]|uniref:DoxX family protein n=1 Tax=Bremerella alba TaxID=980252 RepID=A0A7V9A8G5_9BACT|nr:DoxX family protein [Bremerella alba]MBA2116273.1 hypothetical protein [Bremerella alba]